MPAARGRPNFMGSPQVSNTFAVTLFVVTAAASPRPVMVMLPYLVPAMLLNDCRLAR